MLNILEEFIQELSKEITFYKEGAFSGEMDVERYKYIFGYINGLDRAYKILEAINKEARDSND